MHCLNAKAHKYSERIRETCVYSLTHPHTLYTGKALITAREAAKSCTSDPNLNYTLTLPWKLKIRHINLESK